MIDISDATVSTVRIEMDEEDCSVLYDDRDKVIILNGSDSVNWVDIIFDTSHIEVLEELVHELKRLKEDG